MLGASGWATQSSTQRFMMPATAEPTRASMRVSRWVSSMRGRSVNSSAGLAVFFGVMVMGMGAELERGVQGGAGTVAGGADWLRVGAGEIVAARAAARAMIAVERSARFIDVLLG